MGTVVWPAQPAIVTEWIRQSRQAERAAWNTMMTGANRVEDIITVADQAFTLLTAAFEMPADVRAAYEAWAKEWNALVRQQREARQRRINAREVAAVRAAACPRCFATHAGEC